MLIAPYRDQIGKKMQEESTPLLKSATLSVVKDVAAAMPQTSVDSIDSEAREKELATAAEDLSLFCGLVEPVG